jgi:hypothetical protein
MPNRYLGRFVNFATEIAPLHQGILDLAPNNAPGKLANVVGTLGDKKIE